jgi:hypothetical protein
MPAAAARAYNLTDDDLSSTAVETFASSLQTLRLFTDDYFGLLYSRVPMPRRNGNSLPQFWINANAAIVSWQIERLSGGTLQVGPLSDVWRNAAAEAVTKQALYWRQRQDGASAPRGFQDLDMLSAIYFLFGAEWVPQIDSWENQRDKALADLSFSQLVSKKGKPRDGLSAYAKIMVSLCYLVSGNNQDPNNAVAAGLLQDIVDQLRVQGRTAYLSHGSGSPSPMPLSTQALALYALVHSSFSELSLTEKLANYVSGETPAGGSGRCNSFLSLPKDISVGYFSKDISVQNRVFQYGYFSI